MTEETAEVSMDDVFNDTVKDSAPSEETPTEPAEVLETPEPEPEQAEADETPSDLEAEPPAEKPKPDRVQERINKITREKYDLLRRAEAAEAQLRTQPPADRPEAPKLEDPGIDYDEAEYNQAYQKYTEELIDWKVDQRTKEAGQTIEQVRAEERRNQENLSFAQKVTAAKIDGYEKAMTDLVTYAPLDMQVVDVIQADDNGPQVVHYLGTHLDVAERIAAIQNPAIAALEIGKISAGLSIQPQKQTTKAPSPIKPAKGGGGVGSKNPEDMSMDEIMELDD